MAGYLEREYNGTKPWPGGDMSKYVQARRVADALEGRMRGVGRAGRSLEQIAEDIREQGIYHVPEVLRNSIIGGLEIRRPRGTAENLIIIGCACFGTALPVRSYFLLLEELGLSYTVLRKEYCCGAPLILGALRAGEDRQKYDSLSQEFIGLNIDQAREMGCKRMVHLCLWCAYLSKRFFPNSDIEQVYAPDILLGPLRERELRLPGAAIGYFPGGQHRSWLYAPDRDFEFNWPDYRALLHSIEDLRVVDIPKYCCVIAPDAIFNWARKHQASRVVTPCLPCYGSLSRRAPAGMRVDSIYDLLLEAVAGRG
jgi:Fe-S oxidoreductase